MTEEHSKRMETIRKIKDNKNKYPYLNKVLSYYALPKLKAFLRLADGREIDKKTLIHDNKYPYFTIPTSELIKKHKGSNGTWSRNINCFVTLGLIGKVNPYKVNSQNGLLFQHSQAGKQSLSKKTGISINKIKEQNIYYLLPYTEDILQTAEQREKIMCENGFSIRAFSKIFVQRVFGLDFANTIYFNDIGESEFTLDVFNQIQDIIITKLLTKHFTYKDEVLKNVKIDTDIYRHYEEIYPKAKITSEWKVAEFEYRRSIQIICNKCNFGHSMSNKELNKLFDLKQNKKIIYDKNYVKNSK